jgi:hypothetical protein
MVQKNEMAESFFSITGRSFAHQNCPVAHVVSGAEPTDAGEEAISGDGCPSARASAEEPDAQKAFRSIVNASNCANAGGIVFEGSVTLAGSGVLS